MRREAGGDRLALIGCGAVVEHNHLPALGRIGWRPTLLVDPHLERARALAATVGANAASDFHDHLSEFDAAFVSAPHSLHAPLSCALLEHGKAVLVEKPIANTSAQGERMVATADAVGLPLGVGLMRRHLKAARWAKSVLESGAIGEITSFDVRDGFVYQWMVTSDAIWRKETAGGGVLMDVGTHILDLLLWWVGHADVVSYKDDDYGGVEADCIMELSLPNGARGVVELSRTRNLRQTAIIRGSRGWIEVGVDTNVVRASSPDLLGPRWTRPRARPFPAQSYPDLFEAQVRHWRDVLTAGVEPAVSGREGIASVDLIERCYAAREAWELPWVRPVAPGGGSDE